MHFCFFFIHVIYSRCQVFNLATSFDPTFICVLVVSLNMWTVNHICNGLLHITPMQCNATDWDSLDIVVKIMEEISSHDLGSTGESILLPRNNGGISCHTLRSLVKSRHFIKFSPTHHPLNRSNCELRCIFSWNLKDFIAAPVLLSTLEQAHFSVPMWQPSENKVSDSKIVHVDAALVLKVSTGFGASLLIRPLRPRASEITFLKE